MGSQAGETENARTKFSLSTKSVPPHLCISKETNLKVKLSKPWSNAFRLFYPIQSDVNRRTRTLEMDIEIISTVQYGPTYVVFCDVSLSKARQCT